MNPESGFELDRIALLLGLNVNPDLSLGTLVLCLTIMVAKEMKEHSNRRNNCMRNPDCCNYRASKVKRGCWYGVLPCCRSLQESGMLCWCGGTSPLRCLLPST